MDAFTGTILIWPMTWAPNYWGNCTGTAIQISQNQGLNSLIGNIFGGDGRTEFYLPDLRGRAPLGYNQGLTTLPLNTMGMKTGSPSLALSFNNLPAHTHTAGFTPVMGSQTITLPAISSSGSLSVAVGGKVNTSAAGAAVPASGADVYLGGLSAEDSNVQPCSVTGPYNTAQTGTTANLLGLSASVTSAGYNPGSPASTVTIGALTSGSVSVAAGGGTTTPMPLNNYQPSMALNFIICLSGLYPVRNNN